MVRFPSAEIQARYFPDTVPEGTVTLDCILGLDMRFRNCGARTETPPGYGLAAYAATMLMTEARAEPATVNGVAIENQLVSVPVRVAIGRGRAAAIAAASERVVPPTWRVRPPTESMDRYFPNRAAASGVSGEATVACSVDRFGATRSCRVMSEEPEGRGFGEAAVELLIKEAKFNPQTRNGQPVDGGSINVRVVFKLPK